MPFALPVEISGFGATTPSVSNGNVVEQFSTADILRAAVVAGHGDGGNQVDWRIQAWRIASIRLALDLPTSPLPSLNRLLIHPRAWQRLDPTEKASVNNLLGNTVTKLLCERLLDAPRTWFLDLYENQFSVERTDGRRSDFFTQARNGQWFSLEAKGRSNSPSEASLTSAKAQANALTRVNGADVAAHIVCWTMAWCNGVYARFHDPPPYGQGEINVELDKLMGDYYAPVHELMKISQPEVHSSGLTLYRFDAGDFRIGLHPRVESALAQSQRMAKIVDFDIGEVIPTAAGNLKYGPDGVIVIPGNSWP